MSEKSNDRAEEDRTDCAEEDRTDCAEEDRADEDQAAEGLAEEDLAESDDPAAALAGLRASMDAPPEPAVAVGRCPAGKPGKRRPARFTGPPRRNTSAVAAFALGLAAWVMPVLAFWKPYEFLRLCALTDTVLLIAGAILGLMGMQAARQCRSGYRLALAGLILCAVPMALVIFLKYAQYGSLMMH